MGIEVTGVEKTALGKDVEVIWGCRKVPRASCKDWVGREEPVKKTETVPF